MYTRTMNEYNTVMYYKATEIDFPLKSQIHTESRANYSVGYLIG